MDKMSVCDKVVMENRKRMIEIKEIFIHEFPSKRRFRSWNHSLPRRNDERMSAYIIYVMWRTLQFCASRK